MREHVLKSTTLKSTEWTLAASGPIVIGAILGLGGLGGFGGPGGPGGAYPGALDALHASGALPLLLFGVTVAMIPALYIVTSLTGVAPPARDMLRAVVRGFRACGVVMLGLAAPTAFMLATTESDDAAVVLGALVISAGAIAGLRALFAALFDDVVEPTSVHVVFTIWSLVALAIGARMYVHVMVG